MAVGDEIETRGHIIGFKEEIDKAKRISKDNFFTWFNNANNIEESFVKGAWDFTIHIANAVAHYLDNPYEKTILEIGHGSGRILATASRYFKEAIGIDIHDNNEFVLQELKARGIHNCKLLQTDGTRIPVENSIVDVVYSFIVLQHVEKISIFDNYIKEAHRVLKPRGLAVLYYGRYSKYSNNRKSKALYLLDAFLEKVNLRNGYKENVSRVNETNLIISKGYVKNVAKDIGLEILCQFVSHKKVPNGLEYYGGQNGVLLRKIS